MTKKEIKAICKKCGIIQTKENSFKRGKYLSSYCKKCQVEYLKKYRNENREKMREHWRKANKK